KKLNNRKIELNGAAFTFKTGGLTEVKYDMSWKQNMVNKFADPQIIFFLFIIALAGIAFELKSPGMIIPGAIGGISLILFLLGIKIIPINALGLFLIIAAFVLFVLELQFQSFGLLTLGGIVSFFIGATLLFDSPLPGGGIPISTIITIIIFVLAFVFLVVRAVFNVHKSKITTGSEGIIGETGIALKDFLKKGKISVHGEIWDAESDSPVNEGDQLIVEEVLGMVLKVKVKNN
ncbi:MAG: hypothetical protein FWG49_08300, partial [Leptospirales bacterium]|nr:hypothetical protein [Leptospirales bacterium]